MGLLFFLINLFTLYGGGGLGSSAHLVISPPRKPRIDRFCGGPVFINHREALRYKLRIF